MEILTIFRRLHQEQWSRPRWPGHFLREIVQNRCFTNKNIWQMTTECCIISGSQMVSQCLSQALEGEQHWHGPTDAEHRGRDHQGLCDNKKIFCKYPVDPQDLINIQSFYFVNILSIKCRRSSALSFRWTQPARCLSHIGTHQTLQFCILYFVFCICICIFEIWNTT